MKMKTMAFLLILGLLLAALSTEAEAKAKSFTIRVSCTVPAQLELSSAIKEAANIEQTKAEPKPLQSTPSKIQTQQIRYRENQKEIIYTVLER